MKKILLIDNEDSFVYNLADEFARQNCVVDVYRNSWALQEALSYIHEHQPDALVFSPGPGHPRDATLCHSLFDAVPKNLPILGVCLGHQAMAEHFGGEVIRANELQHGKASMIEHDGEGLFKDLPRPLQVARYHSLVASKLSAELIVTARCGELIMGLKHGERPIYGVQFHPESVLTPEGSRIISNFIKLLG